jgi:phenylpropionate dioxygenase-like ring-hydroxylating dioxygenase large terminal subunit
VHWKSDGRRIAWDGLFTQAWFPLCRSDDVLPGQIIARTFLDGKVVVFRRRDGHVQVLSGYCAHLGADLGRAAVVDDTLVCPLHRWRWNSEGVCVATGTGLLDEPPGTARLFRFPTRERFGLVWAFNGHDALCELPDLSFPDEELECHVGELGVDLPIDPFVFCANGMDVQHLEALHGITFKPEALVDDRHFSYGEFSATIDLPNTFRGEKMHTRWSTWGTGLFTLEGELDDRWFGVVDGIALPAPQLTRTFIVGLARRTGNIQDDSRHAREAFEWERDVLLEDVEVLADLHFRPGPITRSDMHVARYYEYLRNYPRAHPSRDFIN